MSHTIAAGQASAGPREVVAWGNFVDGAWQPSASGDTFASRNPADTRDVVGTFAASGAADVAVAVRAAEQALPGWRETPAPRRGEIPYRFGALLAEHKERLAQHMSREMGKVLDEARGDVQEGIDTAFLMSGRLQRAQIDNQVTER